jgi:hypothetical protein
MTTTAQRRTAHSREGRDDLPIPYIERTRSYYLKLGYGNPYRWASNDQVPFTPLRRPLAEARLALLTTAAPVRPEAGDQGPRAPYNSAAKFYRVYAVPVDPPPDLRISHIGYDREHTTAEDPNTWLPLARLREAVAAGRLGSLAARVYGVPTNRSQVTTVDVDAPAALALLREDGADMALLVPNCPVCHQSMSLVARHLEANGIPTVVMGCAKDIVESAGVPRFLWSDFPLGNSCGRPDDVESQRQTLELALRLLETATASRTTVCSPLRWSDDPSWKDDFSNADLLTPEEIVRRRAAFDRDKDVARGRRG